MTTATLTQNAPATAKGSSQKFIQAPVVEQNIILKAKIRKIEVGDSIQFQSAMGGPKRLVQVKDILTNQKDPSAPRLFIATTRRDETMHVLETQIIHVIPKSKDEYEDLVVQDGYEHLGSL